MTDPQRPRTEAGRALNDRTRTVIGNTHAPQNAGYSEPYLADILAIEAEARAVPLHPDDGHQHWYSCIRCGTDTGFPTLAAPAGLREALRRQMDLRNAALDRVDEGYRDPDEMELTFYLRAGDVRAALEAAPRSPEALPDAALGRSFRAALDGLTTDFRLGFVRMDDGWRSVLLAPDSGQPIAVVDSPTIEGLFGMTDSAASPETPEAAPALDVERRIAEALETSAVANFFGGGFESGEVMWLSRYLAARLSPEEPRP